MPFHPGDSVRLTVAQELDGGVIVPAKSLGTVREDAPSVLGSWVLFAGLRQAILVPHIHLKKAVVRGSKKVGARGAARGLSASGRASRGARQSFEVGDRVVLLSDQTTSGGTIPAGSLGTVTQSAPSLRASWVLFDSHRHDILVPNSDLAAA